MYGSYDCDKCTKHNTDYNRKECNKKCVAKTCDDIAPTAAIDKILLKFLEE